MTERLRCPECGSEEIRLSESRSIKERLMSLGGVRPYSCLDCRFRFFYNQGGSEPSPEFTGYAPLRLKGRTRLYLALSAFSLAAFLIIILAIWLWPSPPHITPPSAVAPAPGPREAEAPARPEAPEIQAPSAGLQPRRPDIAPAPYPADSPVRDKLETRPDEEAGEPETAGPPPLPTVAPEPVPRAAAPSEPAPRPDEQSPPLVLPLGSGGNFSVQMGAFKQIGGAEKYRQKLKEKGLPARVVLVAGPDGVPLHKVLAGSYSSHDQAARAAREIEARLGIRGFPVKAR